LGCYGARIAPWRKIVDGFPRFLDEFEKLITGNEILIASCGDL
jgi:hypothetical protein